MSFALHPRLRADCHVLGQLDDVWLLLQSNALVPWLILVPETQTLEFLSLPEPRRSSLLAHCDQLAQFLRDEFAATRINFASIGNLVPQLHLHIVGRNEADVCWPDPVWGNLPAGPGYPTAQIRRIQTQLETRLGLHIADPQGEAHV